ncbi:MAG: shikimate kinase [Bacteroidales bacterium]|nr:shikimate kinase [Bacteroidales bacterium]
MRIFLIGFMGAGKSKLGRSLANNIGVDFIDLDDEIARIHNQSISKIFEEKGESGFREIEKEVLKDWIKRDNYLMACGGGTPCYKNNMDLMNASGSTVYLDVPSEVLLSRLSNSKVNRPLIQGMTKSELEIYIDNKINERKPYYLKSKIWINPIETSLDTIVTSLRYF